MRGVYHFVTRVYITEPETEVVGLWFYLISQIMDVFIEKHLLTEKSIYLEKNGLLTIHGTFSSFSKHFPEFSMIDARQEKSFVYCYIDSTNNHTILV